MKIGRRAEGRVSTTKPDKNNYKKNFLLFGVIAITVVLIVWVYSMGRKAEQVISVVMFSENIYKNQVITESVLKEYQMLVGEFEKYARREEDGSVSRRILKWDERDKIINWFAAYPLRKDTIAMYTDVLRARTDNSDTVLYSFPGRNIVSLRIGAGDLQAFKTFLQPGDRINITALYKTTEKIFVDDGTGVLVQEEVEVSRQETVFQDIMLADLLNSSGNSVLDLYAEYNDKTVYEQASLDANEAWKASVQPATILVALTPEEEALYYEYENKSDVQFKVSLPQRIK